MSLRTLIYARVSTEDQVEKYGLPVQLRACREYAEHQGWQVVLELSDDGISGSLIERPALDRLRKMVKEGAIDVVLMYDVDRLSRELVHLLILKPEIEKRAHLEFVAGKFEDSPLGRLFFNLRGSIAQFEREQTRERTMRGKREKARAGLVVGAGRTAYGLRYEAGQLLPDPEPAATVRQIFAWYDAGRSMRQIALELRTRGTPSWQGRQWGHTSIARILSNETYAGLHYFGTHRREGKLLLLRAPEERIAVPVAPLVDRAVWERAQARMRENPHGNAGRPSTDYLLRGLFYCHCGRKLAGDFERQHTRVYRCTGRDSLRRRGDACRVRIPAAKIDLAVWSEVAKSFRDAPRLRSMLNEHEQTLRASQDPQAAEHLRQQARKLKAREDSALSLLLDPDLAADRAAIKQQYRQAQAERTRIEGELAEVERVNGSRVSSAEWLDETVELLREYLEAIGDDASEKQAFVRGVVSRADWRAGEVVMRCFVGPQMARTSS
jgi:site-specific DNA recombinase